MLEHNVRNYAYDSFLVSAVMCRGNLIVSMKWKLVTTDHSLALSVETLSCLCVGDYISIQHACI